MRPPRLPCTAWLLGLAALASTARSQCPDPRPPLEGFPIRQQVDLTVPFSDGYRTYLDAVYPSVPPGPCGWPLLVLVHGLANSRKTPSFEAFSLARGGFFVVTYDVRGQGEARTANPGRGTTLWGLDEWIDLAEVIEWSEHRWDEVVDVDRVGVFGDSQGGAHAWAAAAYSGRSLPTNRRRVNPFPRIKAVVPRFFPPDIVEMLVPGGTAFHFLLAGLAYDPDHPVVELDAAFRQKLASLLDAGDAVKASTYLSGLPGKTFATELRTTEVPILAIGASLDPWETADSLLELFESLPATTPHRLYLTTGAHGTPSNEFQTLRTVVLTDTWLRRWLKGDVEPIEEGPRYLSAAIPADPADYIDPRSQWRHRAGSTFDGDTWRRWYLVKRDVLEPEPPKAAAEKSETIENVPAKGYDARAFWRDAGIPSVVEQSLPRSRVFYATPPLTSDLEIAGVPKVHLSITSDRGDFAVACRLAAVALDDRAQVIGTGSVTVRKGGGSWNGDVDLVLGPVNAVVPAGYRVRLEVTNLDIEQPQASEVFHTLPVFASAAVSVWHKNEKLSWLDLPVRRLVALDLATAQPAISVTQPGQQELQLRSSGDLTGYPYLVLLGLSGQGPAIPLPGGSRLWLAPDAMTTAFLAATNRPVLRNFAGLLDAMGNAHCTLDLGLLAPLPAALAGSNLHLVPVVFTPTDAILGGAALELRFY